MDKFIIVLVVVLGIVAIAQLMRVYEQVTALKGKREEHISEKDNHMNANLMLVFMFAFYAFFIWLTLTYGGDNFGKGPAASDIAQDSRWLLNVNWVILIAVFFLTNTLLFTFAWKYYYREDRKAYWFPHSNKLELVWTVIPTIVLAIIIVLGIKTWFNITDFHDPDEMFIHDGKQVTQEGADIASTHPINVEITAEQFAFNVRYAGVDNKLGQSDYKLITSNNPVGIMTSEFITASIDSADGFNDQINKLEKQLEQQGEYLPAWKIEEIESKIIRYNRLKRRLIALAEEFERDTTENWNQVAYNDIIVNGEVFLIKGKRYNFTYRSKDVIHSAYFPHFDSQMNMVPGITTYQGFTPLITTEEMRDSMDQQNFDFVLVCNKICGAGHSSMWAKVMVGTRVDFINYILDKPTVGGFTFKDGITDEEKVTQDSLQRAGQRRTAYDIRDLEIGSGNPTMQWPFLNFKKGQIDTIMMVRNNELSEKHLQHILSEEPKFVRE